MMHSRLFVLASLLACLTIHVYAQEKKKIWQRGVLHTIDSMLTKRYLNAKTDTHTLTEQGSWDMATIRICAVDVRGHYDISGKGNVGFLSTKWVNFRNIMTD